jgi:hypothetical protein
LRLRREGRASARAVTSARIPPRRRSSRAEGCETGAPSVISSECPVAASSLVRVEIEGCLAPVSYAEIVACEVAVRSASAA